MRTLFLRCPAFLLPLALLTLNVSAAWAAAQPAPSQDAALQPAASQVRAELERLQQSLKDKPIANPGARRIVDRVGAEIKDSGDALGAGNLYVSLDGLGRATDLLQGARAIDEETDAVKAGLPAFEAKWSKASAELAAQDKEARVRDWSQKRAAVRALAEVAQTRTMPLMEGSRGFAVATKPEDGLFYMGQAQGEMAFSDFLFRLPLPRAASAPPLRSYLPELQRLQEKANTAFQPPKSIELHDRFIALNSTLKLAGELDSSRMYAGALYAYLEAMRHYGMLDAVTPDEAKVAQLKKAMVEQEEKLEASGRDDSVAQLFLQRAQGWLSHADGSAPSATELRGAQVVVEQVLPAYYAALEPASPVERAAGKTVEITLVRWPYT
jgi:hypothetical protein